MIEDKDEIIKAIKEGFRYDPVTGILTRYKPGSKLHGRVIGSKDSDGYLIFQFMGKFYKVHRVAHLLMTGSWPEMFIDHKDTNVANNKWDNLREVDVFTNNRNRKIDSRNTSGIRGVSWDKRASKWYAYISVNGKMIGLGSYEFKEDAIFARMTAEKEYGYWVDMAVEDL